MERDHEVALSDTSERQEGYSEQDSDESFDDSFDLDEMHNEQSKPRVQPEKGENLEQGNIHPFHSCSYCCFIDIDSKRSSQEYLWAKIRAHPPDAPANCEFFCFCKNQYPHFLDSAALYVCVELKDGEPSTGSKVGFTFSTTGRTLPSQTFLRGHIHSGGPGNQCNCEPALLRQQPSADVFENSRHQIRECELNHQLCPKREQSFTPLRLIHICSPNHIVLHSPKPQEKLKYAILSYCWGGPQQCETRYSNFAERMSSGMPIKELSKTLQEAIEVTNQLGLEYLWADCLCIKQDNDDDKEEQILQMPDIYAAAEITIAASCAKSTSEGFLRAKAPPENLFRFSSNRHKDIFVLVQDQAFADFEPLDTRAWALQETALSIRILNFRAGSVRYECGTSVVDLNTTNSQEHHSIPPLRQLSRNLLGRTTQDFNSAETWLRLVEEYSRRQLTFPDDRLLAISGLADRFGSKLNSSYFAGLWKSQLPYGLLWRCTVPQTRPTNERAPSWSWGSIDGPISYNIELVPGKKHVEMQCHTVSLLPLRMGAKYGSVRSGGSICVSSLIRSMRVSKMGSQRYLVDAKTKTSLHAKLHFDTVSDDYDVENDIVHALNFYKTESLLVREAARNLPTFGFLLVQVSGRNYRRVGIYDAGCSTNWFSDSNFETIYIV